MTYDAQSGSLDHSAAVRLTLWDSAMAVFRTSPLMGTGFNTYAYMHLTKRSDGGVGFYEDTHNIFLKTLVETGVLGLLIFLWVQAKTFGVGYMLFRSAADPFFASLGLGLAVWVVCALTANFFGDRWTYLQVNGYMWVLCGLVAQARALDQSVSVESETDIAADSHSMLEPAPGPA
jgi:O-antigen ligase